MVIFHLRQISWKCRCIIMIISGIILSGSVPAQYFDFELSSVPETCSASKGALSISTEHYKEGSRSLCWTTTGPDVLEIGSPVFTMTTKNCIEFQLYSREITNDLLDVEILNSSGVALRTMTIRINFTGWRHICRYYTEFASTANASANRLRFTLRPLTNNLLRSLCIDDMNLNKGKPSVRLIGNHWAEQDTVFFPAEDKENLVFYNYPVDIEELAPTTEEVSALNALKALKTFLLSPKQGNASELSAAKLYAGNLNIVRNADGSVHGVPVDLSSTALSESFLLQLIRHLEVLAADAGSGLLFGNLLDHLLDQGFAEGLPFELQSNSYTAARNIPAGLFNIIPKCNEQQRREVLKLCKWLVKYGQLYLPENIYKYNINADIVYNYSLHFMKIALNQENDAGCVRELKAFKRFYDRCSEYTPADFDMLKPDGTGFHHGTHYNSYMYAYKTYASYIYYLKNTPFQIEKASYERFKKAYITYFLTMPCAVDDNRCMPFSLCGRKPDALGATVNSAGFLNMISAGEAIYNQSDDEARAAYNYFFKNNYFDVPAADMQGYYAFNYSPLGIYRGKGWIAAMRAPTTKFFGSEIYENANRFGRYQAHGTLEVMYDGDNTNSGYPLLDGQTGGWDWNVVPGATTVHYSNWTDMMPAQNLTSKFAQYALSKNFSGALAWGKTGLFASDFDQSDTWGSKRFTATNLTFKKTILAVDDILINIGSDISTSGVYSNDMETATNLFQTVIFPSLKPMVINRVNINSAYKEQLSAGVQHFIVSPAGTAYILPKGNDPVDVFYGTQTTPVHTGADAANPKTSLTVAKAFINHGVKKTGKSYQMVVIPAATDELLVKYTQMIEEGSLYEILSANSKLHAIYYKPSKVMAYSFFEPQNDVKYGLVKAVDAEALLMYENSTDERNIINFAVVNPNLRPAGEGYRKTWIEKGTNLVVTIAGKWATDNVCETVKILSSDDEETRVEINLSPGMPCYFSLKNAALDTIEPVLNDLSDLYYDRNTNRINLLFPNYSDTEIGVELYKSDGTCVSNKSYKINGFQLQIENKYIYKGILIARVSVNTRNYLYKIAVF